MNANEWLSKLTLKEKTSLCAGKNNWETRDILRLQIPSLMLSDGPHGVRKQTGTGALEGLSESLPATCFPTAVNLASTWNTELIEKVGIALGQESAHLGVDILLGPGTNIKRHPLCGRNFEYFSEDPYLAGKMSAAFIRGVQSQGVGTSLKHFAVNNQEAWRLTIDAIVDERALHEIYLKPFQIAIKDANPWTVMCAYNKINGTYASENALLLNDILRKRFGFEGVIVSDWGAVNERVSGLRATLDLQMPGPSPDSDKEIEKAVKQNQITADELDRSVERILRLVKMSKNTEKKPFDPDASRRLARKVAAESMVLLKNENILPLAKEQKVLIVGGLAKHPRYQGAGSSLVNPRKLTNPHDALIERIGQFVYCQGYDFEFNETNSALITQAKQAAQNADVVIIFAGLPPAYESEGFDREHLNLPKGHDTLIEAISETNKKTVVVLTNGAPVVMPWLENVNAVIEAYLPGEAGAEALWDVIYGEINPSGKLAETFPLEVNREYFPMGPRRVEYRESIYVGYRFYDTVKSPLLFPFGYGLSYTTFDYGPLELSQETFSKKESIHVTMTLKNTGEVAGSEVVQLYVRERTSTAYRPKHELKAFKKVYLAPNEEKIIHFELTEDAFSYYEPSLKKEIVEPGSFEIRVGSHSRDIRQRANVIYQGTKPKTKRVGPDSYYRLAHKPTWSRSDFETLIGRQLSDDKDPVKGEFTLNSTISDIQGRRLGRRILKMMKKEVAKLDYGDESHRRMIEASIMQLPLRNLVMGSQNKIRKKTVKAIVHFLNGKMLHGISEYLKP